jgi:hypothetical protein
MKEEITKYEIHNYLLSCLKYTDEQMDKIRDLSFRDLLGMFSDEEQNKIIKFNRT